MYKYTVAGGMPVIVIDALEVVQIQQQEGERRAVADTVDEQLLDVVQQEAAIVQAGQRISRVFLRQGLIGQAQAFVGAAERMRAFIDEQAAQCGFCLNGVILTAKAFLDKNPKASESEIQQALAGVLCRCFTHVRMQQAIQRYAKEVAK